MTIFLTSISSFLFAVASLNFSTTDFQTSTANCIFNPQDRTLMVDLEVSTSNLTELIVQLTEVGELDLEKAKDQRVAEDFIVEYLEQNFLFIQDGKQLRQNFIKLEVLGEITHLVFDVEVLSSNLNFGDEKVNTEGIQLKNTLFFDLYPGQINIVKVNSKANSADYYFNANNPEQLIAL